MTVRQQIREENTKLDILRGELNSLPDLSAFGMFTNRFIEELAEATGIPKSTLYQKWIPPERDENGRPIAEEKKKRD